MALCSSLYPAILFKVVFQCSQARRRQSYQNLTKRMVKFVDIVLKMDLKCNYFALMSCKETQEDFGLISMFILFL